jgi:hypothetical protein
MRTLPDSKAKPRTELIARITFPVAVTLVISFVFGFIDYS